VNHYFFLTILEREPVSISLFYVLFYQHKTDILVYILSSFQIIHCYLFSEVHLAILAVKILALSVTEIILASCWNHIWAGHQWQCADILQSEWTSWFRHSVPIDTSYMLWHWFNSIYLCLSMSSDGINNRGVWPL